MRFLKDNGHVICAMLVGALGTIHEVHDGKKPEQVFESFDLNLALFTATMVSILLIRSRHGSATAMSAVECGVGYVLGAKIAALGELSFSRGGIGAAVDNSGQPDVGPSGFGFGG